VGLALNAGTNLLGKSTKPASTVVPNQKKSEQSSPCLKLASTMDSGFIALALGGGRMTRFQVIPLQVIALFVV
jgi:hypothetical protein